MSIGTSMGAYYDDEFHREASKWDPKYDNNEVSPNELQDKVDYAPLTIPVADKITANPDQRYNQDQGYSNFFNTPVEGDTGYQDWMANNGKTANESYDYDLQGAYKAGLSPSTDNGHLPDTYKKPNHMTFSDESQYNGAGYWNPSTGELSTAQGGHWDDIGSGQYSFTPGSTNLQFHTPQELMDYFKQYEPGNKLILPGQ